jgi:hypothetical protein
MFEHTASPVAGFWQTRQPSVHSRQVGSGGTKMLAAVGVEAGGTGVDGGVASLASATAGQSAAAATNHKHFAGRFIAPSLPSARPPVEPA